MSEHPNTTTAPGLTAPCRSTGTVDDLATLALSVVAARSAASRPVVSAALTDRMLNAAMARSGESCRLVTRHMLAIGLSPEFIVDEYIPVVARRMGDEWCDDVSSFATVSLGASRLQSLLRELSMVWAADRVVSASLNQQAVLIAVPEDAQHTLGANVLATQIRRAGLSARITIGATPHSLKSILREATFDAVFISASMSDSLDKVTKLVQTAKSLDGPGLFPVVVGGTILEQHSTLQEDSGADLATAKFNEALDFCGII